MSDSDRQANSVVAGATAKNGTEATAHNFLAGLARFVKSMAESQPVELHVYLDEKGTPAVDRRFITGGVAVYGDVKAAEREWDDFARLHSIRGKKGRDLKDRQLRDCSTHLRTQPMLPVGYHTQLSDDELEELRRFAKHYSRSTSPAKLFAKLPPGSFIWKQQMTQAAGTVFASVTSFVGPVNRAALHIEEVPDNAEVRKVYEETLRQNTSKARMAALFNARGMPETLRSVLLSSAPETWSIDLNAKGPLAHLADVACTMYDRWVSASYRPAWDLWRAEHMRAGTLVAPICAGRDGTSDMRSWLRRLYVEGDPDVTC
jgi:hypothetical protein